MNKTKMHVRRDDIVKAITGRDAGKTGKVMKVYPKKGRVMVEGLNFVSKALRKSQDNPNGGIVKREAPMAASNVAVVTPAGKKEKE